MNNRVLDDLGRSCDIALTIYKDYVAKWTDEVSILSNSSQWA